MNTNFKFFLKTRMPLNKNCQIVHKISASVAVAIDRRLAEEIRGQKNMIDNSEAEISTSELAKIADASPVMHCPPTIVEEDESHTTIQQKKVSTYNMLMFQCFV